MKLIIPFIIATLLPLFAVKTFAANPKMIYGTDGRYEADSFMVIPYRPFSEAVAGMVSKVNLSEKKDYYQFYPIRLADTGVPSAAAFASQVVLPDCSGFLVAPDILVTAGHCITNIDDCNDNIWVFDFTFKVSKKGKIQKNNTAMCKQILDRAKDSETENGWIDYAVIQLDHPMTERTPLKYRKSGELAQGTSVFMIGHPLGLPMKITLGAEVWNTQDEWIFSANLDAFGGNSGSPVLNTETGEVEGILVRGSEDFIDLEDGSIQTNICNEGDQSEDCTLGEDVMRIDRIGLDSLIEKSKAL